VTYFKVLTRHSHTDARRNRTTPQLPEQVAVLINRTGYLLNLSLDLYRYINLYGVAYEETTSNIELKSTES